MNSHIIVTRAAKGRLAMVACALILGVTGCEGTAAPTAADSEEAKQMLELALGLWVKGKTVDDAKSGSPSILVSDPKWSRGDKLKKFEINSDGKPSGAERVFTVKLSLLNNKGKEVSETVDYRVGTSPVFTVFRAMF